MKTYNLSKDLIAIRELFDLTQEQFAKQVGLSRSNIIRYETNEIFPRKAALESIYSYPYEKNFKMNKAKEMLYLDNKKGNILLFHGAKEEIKGNIDPNHLNGRKDFGAGFYLGETLDSTASWICEYNNGSVYCFYFDAIKNLKLYEFDVSFEWMFAILYFRGAFQDYIPSKQILEIVDKINNCDYIIAPIADNQMYETLNSFALNQITDEQCLHALSANNLGKQYVIKSQKAVDCLKQIDRLYLCQKEKNSYLKTKSELSQEGRSKALLSINEYRRKGNYFDEIFKKR